MFYYLSSLKYFLRYDNYLFFKEVSINIVIERYFMTYKCAFSSFIPLEFLNRIKFTHIKETYF